MSPEFYSRWKFHQKLGIYVFAVMQAFFSCLIIGFDIVSIKGAVLLGHIALFMFLTVVLKLNNLYSRKTINLIGTVVVIAVVLGLIEAVILYIAENSSAILFAISECLMTIGVYILWIYIMRLWLKRQFCPHEYIFVTDGNADPDGLMELNRLINLSIPNILKKFHNLPHYIE